MEHMINHSIFKDQLIKIIRDNELLKKNDEYEIQVINDKIEKTRKEVICLY